MPAKPKSDNLQTSTSWPTLLTIRIDLQKRLFAPSFCCKPTAGNKQREIPCSCTQIELWNTQRLPAIMQQFPLECNTPRFVFYSSKDADKAKDLCTKALRHNETGKFILKVGPLLRGLSKLCTGKKTKDKISKIGDTSTRPFTNHGVDEESVSNELRRKLHLPLTQSDLQDHGLGYIYILRSQNFSTLAELKIGFTKYHPEHRAHELAQCMVNPEIVGHTPRLPHARRVELIIHTELTSCRKIKFCAQCQRNHRELFTISHIDAREVVTRWSRWILQQPYRDGILTQRWQDHLSTQCLSKSNDKGSLQDFWSDVIEKCPPENPKWSKAEEMGSYVNTIWWDKASRLLESSMGLDIPHKSFEEARKSMRGWKRKRTDGIGFNSPGLEALNTEVFDDFDSDSNSASEPRRKLRPRTLNGRYLERAKYLKEAEEMFNYLKNIKTGYLSVSDPELGISESPLGDATMLPVVELEELGYMDQPVRNWIGYNPTHAGYQMLQEAYQRGEWYGKRPRFKGIKALRDYRRNAIVQDRLRKAEAATPPVNENLAPAPDRSNEPQKSPKAIHLSNDASPRSDLCEPTDQGRVKYIGDSKGRISQIQFSYPTNSDLMNKVQEGLDLIKNGGRAEVERRLKKSLAYYGIDRCLPDTDEDTSSDDESDTYLEEDIGKNLTETSNPELQIPNQAPGFSKRTLGKWFESM